MGACLQYLLVYHEGWIQGGSAQDTLPRSQKNIFRHVLRLERSPTVKPPAAGIGRTFAGLEPTRKKPGSILGVGMEGPAAFGVGRLSSMASGPTVRTPRGVSLAPEDALDSGPHLEHPSLCWTNSASQAGGAVNPTLTLQPMCPCFYSPAHTPPLFLNQSEPGNGNSFTLMGYLGSVGGCCSHQGSLCPLQSQKVPLLVAESWASSCRTPRTLSSSVTGPCRTQGQGKK